ncbi:phosphoribosylamine--glycine ligase [Candidatus Micrarchaeota archaeon CG08_land_8_20_14_0_20_59_11]|nr:MAG: phosphoribosylamine--glycine ligase [Candidatus Micrarchaeota archaeon CG08_land_8_20_14_0_20_59_11]
MRVLLIGKSARTDVIAEAIVRSRRKPLLFSMMDAENPGVMRRSKEFCVAKTDDAEAVLAFAERVEPDFSIIDPEDPIAHGVSDALEKAGIPCVAPSKKLGQLESSKSFCRELLRKHGIEGNPEYRIFRSGSGIENWLRELLDAEKGFVVKPDGLTGGKGVKVLGDHLRGVEDALDYCEEVLAKHASVVIEEKLEGEEFSLQSLTDGVAVQDCPPVQDHKRAFEGDEGPNTGGMGSYSCENHLLPFMGREDAEAAHAINEKVAAALLKETGAKYRGVLYGGFICTRQGVKLIEYNVRFGDPEAMNVLPIMKSDFVDVCESIINGKLDETKLRFENAATVCKYAVPEGYPSNPIRGALLEVGRSRARYYYGAVREENGKYVTLGSRAIASVGIAPSLAEAEKIAEEGVGAIKGAVFHRRDIGTQALINRRIEHMKRLRKNG